MTDQQDRHVEIQASLRASVLEGYDKAASERSEKIATTDALSVAARILARGTRAAIGASSIEIIAMAKRLNQLATLADLTFDMLATADELQAVRDPDQRRVMRGVVTQKISVVGAALEQLGYGQESLTEPTTNQEKCDGTKS